MGKHGAGNKEQGAGILAPRSLLRAPCYRLTGSLAVQNSLGPINVLRATFYLRDIQYGFASFVVRKGEILPQEPYRPWKSSLLSAVPLREISVAVHSADNPAVFRDLLSL